MTPRASVDRRNGDRHLRVRVESGPLLRGEGRTTVRDSGPSGWGSIFASGPTVTVRHVSDCLQVEGASAASPRVSPARHRGTDSLDTTLVEV